MKVFEKVIEEKINYLKLEDFETVKNKLITLKVTMGLLGYKLTNGNYDNSSTSLDNIKLIESLSYVLNHSEGWRSRIIIEFVHVASKNHINFRIFLPWKKVQYVHWVFDDPVEKLLESIDEVMSYI